MLIPLRYVEAFGPWYVFDVWFSYWSFREVKRGIREGKIVTKGDKMFFYGMWVYGVIITSIIPILMLMSY